MCELLGNKRSKHHNISAARPDLLPEAVRLENLEDSRNRLGKLMQRWDYLMPRKRNALRKSKVKKRTDFLSNLQATVAR
jgi:hypothetical protein